jgi:hypothetical protein
MLINVVFVAGVIALAWSALVSMVVFRLRRRNAVARRRGHGAPLTWLVSPSFSAHLHRRLRRAAIAVRIAVPSPPRRSPRGSFHDVADDLERQAVAADAELVAARPLPHAHRRELHRLIAGRVGEIERLVAAVVATMSTPEGQLIRPRALDELGTRIDALQQAHDELARIERVAGLRAG